MVINKLKGNIKLFSSDLSMLLLQDLLPPVVLIGELLPPVMLMCELFPPVLLMSKLLSLLGKDLLPLSLLMVESCLVHLVRMLLLLLEFISLGVFHYDLKDCITVVSFECTLC